MDHISLEQENEMLLQLLFQRFEKKSSETILGTERVKRVLAILFETDQTTDQADAFWA